MDADNLNERFQDLDYLFCRDSKFAPADFAPDEALKTLLFDMAKVLVIGAGGLGCEILKDLAMSGFRDITVIDMDTIDVTNLNRQFLFRKKDVGKYKSDVAAAFIEERCPGVKVTAHTSMIQDFDTEFYQQFHVIIAGLDNIEARRWLNALVHSMVEFDENNEVKRETVKPLIDGGTEGFRGQARLIMPYISGCFECTLSSLPKQNSFPMCTIAETPRLPEHCIQHAYVIQWPEKFKDKKVDKDSPDDMKWIYERAVERADTYGIEGVTYSLTMGVVKNIIPAIASTNALVSAACTNEALKVCTYCNNSLDNYYMFMGQSAVYTSTFQFEKDQNCIVCSSTRDNQEVAKDKKFSEFRDEVIEKYSLSNPGMASESKGNLYIPGPLGKKTKDRLDMTMGELVEQGLINAEDVLEVTDKVIPTVLRITIHIK